MKTTVIFIVILIISAIVNFLLLSKFSFGDDRDRKIFNKTCSHTLMAFIIYLLLDMILPFTNNTDSVTNLFVISFLFLINQLVYRKKFSWFLIKILKFGTKKSTLNFLYNLKSIYFICPLAQDSVFGSITLIVLSFFISLYLYIKYLSTLTVFVYFFILWENFLLTKSLSIQLLACFFSIYPINKSFRKMSDGSTLTINFHHFFHENLYYFLFLNKASLL